MIDIDAISEGLCRVAEGQWEAAAGSAVSYPDDGNALCFDIEDRSFWFCHRNRCIATLVNRYPPPGAVFDIGGGNGFVAKGLEDAGFETVLLEPGRQGVQNARKRGVRTTVAATLQASGFRASTLPAAGLFDVLEHIEDDLGFLTFLRRLIRDAGRLYLTVPAFSALWSHEDESAGHFRRYGFRRLKSVLHQAGFGILYATAIFRPLPFPIFLARTLPHRFGLSAGARPSAQNVSRDHAQRPGAAGRALAVLLGREIGFIEKGASSRFGGSWLVAAAPRHR